MNNKVENGYLLFSFNLDDKSWHYRAVSGYGKRESETVTSSEHEKVEQQQPKQRPYNGEVEY